MAGSLAIIGAFAFALERVPLGKQQGQHRDVDVDGVQEEA